MKKKLLLSAAFILSLLPMLLVQYGGRRGVQEISGLINLLHPIGILSVAVFALGVWAPFRSQKTGKLLGAAGVIGIAVSEIYQYLFWYVQTITGQFALHDSIRFAFPAFYFGLFVSLAMILFYFRIDRIVRE